MSSSQTSIFTIGHSNHPWEKFAALLQNAKIETLADIRSFPRSRLAHFNQAQLRSRLEPLGIEYRFLGVELGGRQQSGEPLDYEEAAARPEFSQALDDLVALASKSSRVAIMCSEHDPLQCHRFHLVSRSLAKRGVEIAHIMRDGVIKEHAAVAKLIAEPSRDLFGKATKRKAR
jgi:uncharacterized protein (DUF488 family)